MKVKKYFSGGCIWLFMLIAFSSCLMNDDLMTSNVHTGGLLDATTLIQYKAGSLHNDTISVVVYQGPAVTSIKIFKSYTHIADGSETDEILLDEVAVNGLNEDDTLVLDLVYGWDQLSQGFSKLGNGVDDFPQTANLADIGDYFTLRYVSVLSDGTEASNRSKTEVLVANSYAGYYRSQITYFHPTLGGTYPTVPYWYGFLPDSKELITISSNQCSMNFSIWGSDGETMTITIEQDNTVTFEVVGFEYIVKAGDPYDSSKASYYDSSSKTIYLYYYWEGPGGYRVMWEVLYPDF
ncbi:MAG TPA: DUF4361 domain-containing protein [Tenuifilaceae bacterium]|nr:DUF4361 domain-containing protein [Tenuifilaceae bacterium]